MMELKDKIVEFINDLREDAQELANSSNPYKEGCADARFVIANDLTKIINSYKMNFDKIKSI